MTLLTHPHQSAASSREARKFVRVLEIHINSLTRQLSVLDVWPHLLIVGGSLRHSLYALAIPPTWTVVPQMHSFNGHSP